MHTRKVIAGAAVIILAFCAGVGLDFFRGGRTVLGAPPSPLTSVAHNSTLDGSGTPSDRLGVADKGMGTEQLKNGAVTLPKLSIAGSPAIGKSVGYNGSGLAWGAPDGGNGGGVRVVDAVGHSYPLQIVSGLVDTWGAVWQTAGQTFVIPLTPQGLPQLFYPTFVYTSTDCPGPAYMQGGDPSTFLIQQFGGTYSIIGTTLFYSTGAQQALTAYSYKSSGIGGPCTAMPSGSTTAGVSFATVNLSSAFVAPFHVELN